MQQAPEDAIIDHQQDPLRFALPVEGGDLPESEKKAFIEQKLRELFEDERVPSAHLYAALRDYQAREGNDAPMEVEAISLRFEKPLTLKLLNDDYVGYDRANKVLDTIIAAEKVVVARYGFTVENLSRKGGYLYNFNAEITEDDLTNLQQELKSVVAQAAYEQFTEYYTELLGLVGCGSEELTDQLVQESDLAEPQKKHIINLYNLFKGIGSAEEFSVFIGFGKAKRTIDPINNPHECETIIAMSNVAAKIAARRRLDENLPEGEEQRRQIFEYDYAFLIADSAIVLEEYLSLYNDMSYFERAKFFEGHDYENEERKTAFLLHLLAYIISFVLKRMPWRNQLESATNSDTQTAGDKANFDQNQTDKNIPQLRFAVTNKVRKASGKLDQVRSLPAFANMVVGICLTMYTYFGINFFKWVLDNIYNPEERERPNVINCYRALEGFFTKYNCLDHVPPVPNDAMPHYVARLKKYYELKEAYTAPSPDIDSIYDQLKADEDISLKSTPELPLLTEAGLVKKLMNSKVNQVLVFGDIKSVGASNYEVLTEKHNQIILDFIEKVSKLDPTEYGQELCAIIKYIQSVYSDVTKSKGLAVKAYIQILKTLNKRVEVDGKERPAIYQLIHAIGVPEEEQFTQNLVDGLEKVTQSIRRYLKDLKDNLGASDIYLIGADEFIAIVNKPHSPDCVSEDINKQAKDVLATCKTYHSPEAQPLFNSRIAALGLPANTFEKILSEQGPAMALSFYRHVVSTGNAALEALKTQEIAALNLLGYIENPDPLQVDFNISRAQPQQA